MPQVLVVDDTPVDRTLAGGLLDKSDDLQVQFAENGAAALDMLQQSKFDLVVTDLQMPEVDGLELVTRIQMVQPDLPVILMTAQGSETIAIEALQQGAAGYVPKSQLANLLQQTAEEVLAMSRADFTGTRLMQCQRTDQASYALENDPELIEAVVDSLQQQIAGMGFADHTEKLRIGVAVREALLNALLHGNLELTRDDLATPSDIIQQRAGAEPHCSRRIHLSWQILEDQATFAIRDEGPGFDASLYDQRDLSSPESLQPESGRGIVLMQTFMDDVRYNDAGNEVTLVKRRNR